MTYTQYQTYNLRLGLRLILDVILPALYQQSYKSRSKGLGLLYLL